LAELALETFGLIPSHIDTEPARAGLEARLGALEAGAVS
jgi:hypothetical protein